MTSTAKVYLCLITADLWLKVNDECFYHYVGDDVEFIFSKNDYDMVFLGWL